MNLGNICDLIVDCEHKTAPTQETGYPSIRTPNIGPGYFLLENVNRVSEETYRYWTRRAIPQTDDLIMAREAPVGNVAIIPPGLRPCLGQRTVLIRCNLSKVVPRYLNYLLNGPEVQGTIKKLTNGVTVSHLNMEDIRSLPLPDLPPLPTQQKIAAILSAYDDLIENNTRRIRILEEMAQAIYREWFVHFRYPGHEDVPLVESPLGPIPQGWEWVRFADILNSYSGGDWGEEENGQEKCHVYIIRGADFRTLHNGGTIQAPRRFIATNSLIKRNLRPGDIIIENSVNASSRCIGSSFLVTRGILNRFKQDVICASFCKNFRLNDPDLASLVYLHLKYLYASQKMAFYQHIATNGIGNFQAERFVNSEYVPLPKDHELLLNLCKQLDAFVSSVFADQIFNLRQQRDLLLPRLISGELDVESLDLPIS